MSCKKFHSRLQLHSISDIKNTARQKKSQNKNLFEDFVKSFQIKKCWIHFVYNPVTQRGVRGCISSRKLTVEEEVFLWLGARVPHPAEKRPRCDGGDSWARNKRQALWFEQQWEAATHTHTQTAVPDPQQPCPQVSASWKTGETPDASQKLWAVTWKKKGVVEDWQEGDTDGGLELCMKWKNLTVAAEA